MAYLYMSKKAKFTKGTTTKNACAKENLHINYCAAGANCLKIKVQRVMGSILWLGKLQKSIKQTLEKKTHKIRKKTREFL